MPPSTPELKIGRHELDRLLIIVIGTFCIASLCYAGVILVAIAQPTDQAWVKGLELSISASAAIFTAAAAGVALWLGLATERRLHRDAVDRALLTATRVGLRLTILLRDLRQFDDDVHGMDIRGQILDFAERLTVSDYFGYTDEELINLVPLGRDCPQCIAAGLEMLKHSFAEARQFDDDAWDSLSDHEQGAHNFNWKSEVHAAFKYIEQAHKAIKVIAPPRWSPLDAL